MNFEIVFGSIILRFDGDKLWLETDEGEAMEVSNDEIEKLLSDYYAGNFYMGGHFLVNSEHSLTAFGQYVRKMFAEHKYLTFSAPRIGPDRSLDQNALAHLWLTEYAAHLLRKDKRDVTPGELEGMKRVSKKEFYLETRYHWMVHVKVNPRTKEEKKDFTSSKSWKKSEMTEFLEWLQAVAAHDGLVLESRGEFAKLQREKIGSV